MIKDRVIQLLEYKGIAKEDFFRKIGMTSANFRGNARKTPLNSTAIANIISEIPEANSDWLLTGVGDMFKMSRPVEPSPKNEKKGTAVSDPEAIQGILFQMTGVIHGQQKDISLLIQNTSRLLGELERNGRRSDQMLRIISQGYGVPKGGEPTPDR